jgi:hypothetical protein
MRGSGHNLPSSRHDDEPRADIDIERLIIYSPHSYTYPFIHARPALRGGTPFFIQMTPFLIKFVLYVLPLILVETYVVFALTDPRKTGSLPTEALSAAPVSHRASEVASAIPRSQAISVVALASRKLPRNAQPWPWPLNCSRVM